MTAPTLEWYREQSKHSRAFYELVHATWPDKFHDWKVNPLFYSALHRVNYWLVRETGQAPRNHVERNRRVEVELPQVFGIYNDLYLMSMRARYRAGFRMEDLHRRDALGRLNRLERKLPFT